jgi:CheY-like chemotaxis protein
MDEDTTTPTCAPSLPRAIFASRFPDLILHIDGDGRLLDCNAPRGTFLARPLPQCVGCTLDELFPAEVAAALRRCAADARRCDATQELEYQLIVGGELRDFEARVVAGDVADSLLVLRDVTARKRTERPRHSAPAASPFARVLVADDGTLSRKLSLRLLEKRGLQADAAADGREAVAAHVARAYDLIFMDCRMPEMDGYEATRAIRALPGATQPVIVAMTANSAAGDREACLAAGMDDYLTKPLAGYALDQMLARWAPHGSRG